MSYTDFDFPHTSLYKSDLRELIANMRKLEDIVKEFVNLEQLKFADPITWNITSQYQKGTIVIDSQGNAYISKDIVPAGVRLDNEDYWLEIFNFMDYVKSFNSNLTFNVESNTDRATSAYNEDDWLILNDILYLVTQNIAIDELFIIYPTEGYNIKHFTVEDFIKAFTTWATNTIQQYKNDIDASELQYREQLAQDIATTTANLQAQLDIAISGATVDSEIINARIGANGVTYATLGEAIRTQISSTIRTAAIATQIPDESDLNDYTTGGQFYIASASSAATILNYPDYDDKSAGQLIVMRPTVWVSSLKPRVQFYITTTAHLYMRRGTTAGVYDPWQRIANTDMIDTVANDLSSLANNTFLLNASIDIPALNYNDDLNTYLTPGQWRVTSQAMAKSLINKPEGFASTGEMLIFNTHNNNHVYQVIVSNGLTNIWTRHIMISTSNFDKWKSLIDANDNSYSWERAGFLLHDPKEETKEMVDTFEEYLNETITNTTDWVATTDGVFNVTGAKIQSLWDELQTRFPEYIEAGETIGYSKNPDGTNYAPIKAYHIHPRKTYTTWEGTTINIAYDTIPTIFLCAGTHSEPTPTWNLFTIFKRAFEMGTAYSDILNNVQFRIIPCLDIWSYDHGKRYSPAAYDMDGEPLPNAIDPDTGEIKEMYDNNRQCICSNMSSPSYSNLQLYSFATEAKALTDYVQSCGFSANDIFIDLHNCSYSLGYEASTDLTLQHKFNLVMDELAKDWLVKSTFANGDPVDYYASSTSDHTRQRGKILGRSATATTYAWFFGKAYNTKSNLLEVQSTDGTRGSNYAFAKGLDITYRWLKFLLKYLY